MMKKLVFILFLFGLGARSYSESPSSVNNIDTVSAVSTVSDIHILVTAFEPFNGSKENGSKIVARELLLLNDTDIKTDVAASANLSEKKASRIIYHTCILPVTYDKAFEKAKECFLNLNPKPDLVVSSGEGSCDFRLEIRAHNLDDMWLKDEDGVVRRGHTVEENAPENEQLTFPVADMFCATKFPIAPRLSTSLSPGHYVCNNTAFHMARWLKPQQVPFSFFHLPTSSCDAKPADTAQKFDLAVRAALRALSINTTVFYGTNANFRNYVEAKDLPPVSSKCREAAITDLRKKYGFEMKIKALGK